MRKIQFHWIQVSLFLCRRSRKLHPNRYTIRFSESFPLFSCIPFSPLLKPHLNVNTQRYVCLLLFLFLHYFVCLHSLYYATKLAICSTHIWKRHQSLSCFFLVPSLVWIKFESGSKAFLIPPIYFPKSRLIIIIIVNDWLVDSFFSSVYVCV